MNHAATEKTTLWTTCGLELQFLGYKYWMTSPLEKQELEQLNLKLLQML